MDNDDARLTPYFNSYSQLAPGRVKYLQEGGPSFDEWLATRPENLSSIFNPLDKEAHPILYQAFMDECSYRQIDVPSCYVLTKPIPNMPQALALAFPLGYGIAIQDIVIPKLTKEEMRALVAHEIKHLYQAEPLTRGQHHANEYDADRASADSTDYETVRSMMFKLLRLQIEKTPDSRLAKALQLKIMDLCPNFFIEHYGSHNVLWNETSPRHPTTAKRLKKIKPAGNAPS